MTLTQAKELLLRVETECSKVGLGLNGPKPKYSTYNIEEGHAPLHTRAGMILEEKKTLSISIPGLTSHSKTSKSERLFPGGLPMTSWRRPGSLALDLVLE